MTVLTRDGMAKPVSRGQFFRRERGQGKIDVSCSADHEQIYSLTRLMPSLLKVTHTYISDT